MTNTNIIQKLRSHAKWLDVEGGNLYQVRAYRQAAEIIARMDSPLEQLFAQHGETALRELPGIGSHISFALVCLLTKGTYHAMTDDYYRIPRGERLADLSGLGPHLAELLWDKLAILSMDELEQVLVRGDLQELPISSKRQKQWLNAIRKQHGLAVSQAG